MALKNCRECGRPISPSANPCPLCGKRNPHGLSFIVKHGGGFLVFMFGLTSAFAAFRPESGGQATKGAVDPAVASDPLPTPQERPPTPPATAASSAPAVTAPPGSVLVSEIIGDVGPHAGLQCARMPEEPSSCQFQASKAFPFMVKVVSQTSPIAPESLVEEMNVVFPARYGKEHEGAAMYLLISMAKVADVHGNRPEFFTDVFKAGSHRYKALKGGVSRLNVRASELLYFAQVRRPR